MRFVKYLLIGVLFYQSIALGNGPNEGQVLEAYFKSKEVTQAIDDLKIQNYEIKSTSAVLIHGIWSEEGLDGTYLISTDLRRGEKPWNIQMATVVAIVERSAGWIKQVRLIDSQNTETALWSLK